MLYECHLDGTYRLGRILDTTQSFQWLRRGWKISSGDHPPDSSHGIADRQSEHLQCYTSITGS